jgi:hypothetical protein
MANVSKLIFGAAIALMAGVVVIEKPAEAQSGGWCAYSDEGVAAAAGIAGLQHCKNARPR